MPVRAITGGVGAVPVRQALRRKSSRRMSLSVSLAITIYWAEQLGEEYDLETAGVITPIHLWMAKFTVAAWLRLYSPVMARTA